MNYNKIKKIDEESLKKLREGTGPSDKCLCSLLSPPEDRKGLRASIKKAFASLGPGKKGRKRFSQKTIEIKPLTALSTSGGKFRTKKEVVRRKTSCGKCGCDKENVVLKHSFANIRIISPDVSSFCTCLSNCLPGKELFKNNIKVTIEHLRIYRADSADSDVEERDISESLLERESVLSLNYQRAVQLP